MPELTSPLSILALVAVLGYLLGSVPFGVVISRVMGLGDVRSIGSGNIGATNVLRTGNKLAAFLTLVCDGGKGAAAVLIARALAAEDAAQVAGLFAFLGHLYPVWLGFKGGKGVATFLGTLIALGFGLGLFTCLIWLATAFAFRYSSLAALVAAASAPVTAWGMGFGASNEVTVLSGVLAGVIWVRHAANIRRLIAGKEPKIGKKRKGNA